MYSYTNQSLFIFTEFKYRCFYLLYSIFMLIIYFLYYFNTFLVIFLKPIEYLNLDINLSFFISFLVNYFTLDVSDFNNFDVLNSIYKNEHFVSYYDFFPTFEIAIKNNLNSYFYILSYFIILLSAPIMIYQIYLFLLPALYQYEKKKLFIFIWFFITWIFLFIEYFNSFFCFLYLLLTWNIFHEYYHYEFDVEFDFENYSKFLFFSVMLSYINLCYLFFLSFLWERKNELIYIYILFNLYMYIFIFNFLFFNFMLYFFIYLNYMKLYIYI